jgi:two-component system, sensor histidine kinase PdtaS
MSPENYLFRKNILDAMFNPICYKDRNGIYLGVNKIFTRQIVGIPEDEIVGCTLAEVARKVVERFPERSVVNEWFLPKYETEWDMDDTVLLKCGGTSIHEYEGICADGIKRTFLVNKSTFNNEKREISGLIAVLQDITELNEVKKTLEKNEKRYRSFIQNFKGIAFQLDENFVPEFMHGEVEEITGYSGEEFLSGQVLWISIIHPADKPLVVKDVVKIRNSPYNLSREFEFRIIHKNGRIRWVHQTYQKIQGKDGIPDKYQGVIYDITGKRDAEEALVKIEAIRKKEIHHRIKNNLQVISSLLDLQAEKFNNRECIKDSEVLKAFRESQDRVMSIALIHEELHENGGADKVNFSLYLEKLVENLFHTYRLGNADINLNMELEENLFFDMDIAVPLGIIINELVSNSLKYAFLGKEKGLIKVKLCREGVAERTNTGLESKKEGSIGTIFILTVSDNGVGMPKIFNSESSDSLGLQLVTTLIDQLDGELELKGNPGAEFVIRFTVAEKIIKHQRQPSSN